MTSSLCLDLRAVAEPGLPHNTDNPEHSVVDNSSDEVDLHLDIKQQTDKFNKKLSMHDDGYDTQESTDDLTPEVLEAKESVFRFDSVGKDNYGIERNTSIVADIQKRERDARNYVKSILVIGTASVALSTIHESYVGYCETNGTKALQLSQLKCLLKNEFPLAVIQNKIVNGIKTCMLIGIQLLVISGVNQNELGKGINAQVSVSDHSHILNEESSDQGYNSDNSQTDESNLSEATQNNGSSKFDLKYEQINSDPVDLSIRRPQQLIGGNSAGFRLIEPFYATEAEPASKIREIRREAHRYQQQVENRSTTFENVNQNSTMTAEDEVESCKGAAKRLSHVITWMKDNGHTKILLRDFAHSASCLVAKCSPFCMMFRRVRRHVVGAKHQCVLLRLYSLLLRLHVNLCNNDNCGLQACPTLRANKSVKRSASEEANSVAKRPSHVTMIQSDRVVPNPLLFPTPASNHTGNQVVVLVALPANRREVTSVGKLKIQK
ncbi:unnamed protein product [Meganyctiphanes norvegica]|uniref:Uncharacterized protein n=1 Tax=Meganyctiphanes norvegica TaxID=48144 RepID=A0AAV2RQJ4_MEGNR